ncbi:MAG: glycine cleavage system protein GcvH [Pseudomonadota bacterium]
MNIPDDLKYAKEHEWVKVEKNIATIGITDHAQSSLGDIVYLELPNEGEAVTKNETFGVVESVKAVSDCYAPVSGTVKEVNTPATENPETLNEDCYGEGWMIRIEMSDKKDLEDLMDAKQYEEFLKEETA